MKKKYKRSFNLAFCSKRGNDKIGIRYTFDGKTVKCSIYDEYAYNVILPLLKTLDIDFMLPESSKIKIKKNCVVFTALSKCHPDDQYTVEEGTLFSKQKALELRSEFYEKYTERAIAMIEHTWWESSTRMDHSIVKVLD